MCSVSYTDGKTIVEGPQHSIASGVDAPERRIRWAASGAKMAPISEEAEEPEPQAYVDVFTCSTLDGVYDIVASA